MLKVAALYQFASLPDFRELREPLRALCARLSIKGSILLAAEGINGTVAGQPDAIDVLVAELRTGALFGGRLDNLDWVLSAGTPQFKRFSADVSFIWGQDENFYEWTSADIVTASVNVSWRPIDKLRVDGQYQHLEYNRKADGSTVGIRKIPRLKVEYQIARPMFFRVVGQYDAEQQDALYQDVTHYGIVRPLPQTGIVGQDFGFSRNDFRVDWLFSYQPTPGTVMFAGYGGSYEGEEHLRVRGMERTDDGFFVKLSYLFRM